MNSDYLALVKSTARSMTRGTFSPPVEGEARQLAITATGLPEAAAVGKLLSDARSRIGIRLPPKSPSRIAYRHRQRAAKHAK